MSQENVNSLERLVDALGQGDVDGVLRLVTEDVVWIAARSAVEGTFHGHEGIRRFCSDNAESFEVFRLGTSVELRDLGDRVLAIGTIHIRGRGSGVETEIPVAGVATFDGGRLSRWEDFRDRALALEALGLSE
jgi:ketosteroid isomerase-like protein